MPKHRPTSWYASSACLAIAAAAVAAPALAQSAGPTALEEVVVTAQRREQRNVEVPVSIVSQTAEQLQTANITNTMQLGNVVPGLLMTRVGAPAAPAIRGISTKVTSPGSDANVSVYVDGFYQANAIALNRTLLDVANVEVLRGPQGTLFGRNSTGGAILITSRKPSHKPVLATSVSVEGHKGRLASIYASAGLTDTLAVSLTATYNRSDGWLRNRSPGKEFPTAPQRGNYLRARVLFEPTDRISFDASYEHGFMQDGTGVAFTHVAHPLIPGVFPQLHLDPKETSLTTQSKVKDIWDAGYLTMAYDLGFATLKSMTQVREDRSPWSFDLDGTPVLNPALQIFTVAREKMQTQEVNLTSKGDSRLQWIVGGFYFHDESEFRVFSTGSAYGNKTRAWAGYADATYRIGDNLFLTGGVRYSEERKACLSVDPVGSGGGKPLLPCLGGNPIHHENATTPRANLRYQFSPTTSAYVSYSRGFKSGGFNDATAVAPYNPEKITDWEAGFKTYTARYRFEASVFHYDYKNLQFTYACTVVVLPFCPQAAGTRVVNAAKAKSYGAETQLTWVATDRVRFSASVAYLHAKYDRFLNASAAAPRKASDTPPCTNPDQRLCSNVGVAQDWSGQRLIRAPKWSGNLGVNFDQPTEAGTFSADAIVSYTSKFQSDTDSLDCITTNCGQGLSPRRVVPSYTLVNVTVSWRSPDEHLQASLYARNLFDKTYLLRADASTVADTVIGAEGRVVGVRLNYNY